MNLDGGRSKALIKQGGEVICHLCDRGSLWADSLGRTVVLELPPLGIVQGGGGVALWLCRKLSSTI